MTVVGPGCRHDGKCGRCGCPGVDRSVAGGCSPWGGGAVLPGASGLEVEQFYAIRNLAREGGRLAAVTGSTEVPSKRPDRAIAPALVAAAVRIRKELADAGWDHGPMTVRHRMLQAGLPAPSRATLARVFTAHGMVVPQPQKRPRSSYRRFTFARVHECWQLDATEWRLADGSEVTIFQLLDDHSRFLVGLVGGQRGDQRRGRSRSSRRLSPPTRRPSCC